MCVCVCDFRRPTSWMFTLAAASSNLWSCFILYLQRQIKGRPGRSGKSALVIWVYIVKWSLRSWENTWILLSWRIWLVLPSARDFPLLTVSCCLFLLCHLLLAPALVDFEAQFRAPSSFFSISILNFLLNLVSSPAQFWTFCSNRVSSPGQFLIICSIQFLLQVNSWSSAQSSFFSRSIPDHLLNPVSSLAKFFDYLLLFK